MGSGRIGFGGMRRARSIWKIPVATVAILLSSGCLGRVVATPQATPVPTPAAGPCGGPPGGLALQGPKGRCIPAERMLLWPCDGSSPSFTRTIDGVAQRFLGGRYAVPVPAPPPQAELVSSIPGWEVFVDPADAEGLWIRRDGATSRWLPLPAVPPADPPSVYFIGDSITDGASSFLPAALPSWTVGWDAVPGRGSVSGVSIAQAQALAAHDVVVIELGTNDQDIEGFSANMAAILDSLEGTPMVIWQTVKGPEPTVLAADVNRVIRDTARSYPNVAIADWAAIVHDEALADGVHPTGEEADLMARVQAPLLDAWLSAAWAPPSDGCSLSAATPADRA